MSVAVRLVLCRLVLLIILCVSALSAADNLGSALKVHRWDRLIGTWVDAGTQGALLKTTYAWKYKDMVIENTTVDGKGKRTISLIGRNSKTGVIFSVAANSGGGSSQSTLTLNEKQAVFDINYVTEHGQEGKIKLYLEFLDDDTLNIIIDAPEPIVIKMLREVAPNLLDSDKKVPAPNF